MANNPVTGIGYVFKGMGLITRPGIRKFVAIPFLINLVLFSSAIYLGADYFNEWLLALLPDWLDWLNWLLVPLVTLVMLTATFYTFTILANIIAAPFNAILSARVEKELTGKAPPEMENAGFGTIAKEVGRTLASEVRKLSYFLIRAIPIFILFVIPVVNIAAPFIWLAFSAWFLAVEYADFPMGNHRKFFKDELDHMKRFRWSSFGFGGSALLMTTIPIINFIAVPVAVCAATVMWIDQRDNA